MQALAQAGKALRNLAKPIAGTLLTIAGTLLTVAIGAGVTFWLNQPVPTIGVDRIEVSTLYNDRFGLQTVEVPVGDQFFSDLDMSIWTEPLHDPYDDLGNIVRTLQTNKTRVDSYLRHLRDFAARYQEMRNQLAAPRTLDGANGFFDSWAKLDGFIYLALQSAADRGLLQHFAQQISPSDPLLMLIPAPSISAAGPQPTQVASLVMPGRLDTPITSGEVASQCPKPCWQAVRRRGSRYASRPGFGSERPDLINLQDRVLEALAKFDQPALMELLGAVYKESEQLPLYEKISDGLRDYIRAYSRWTVSVIVANSGKDPISFSPHATMHVNTAGANGFAVDRTIELESRDKDGNLQSLTVPGGQSQVITLASTKVVMEDKEWRHALALFDSGSRNCHVVLHRVTATLLDEDFKSPDHKFNSTAAW